MQSKWTSFTTISVILKFSLRQHRSTELYYTSIFHMILSYQKCGGHNAFSHMGQVTMNLTRKSWVRSLRSLKLLMINGMTAKEEGRDQEILHPTSYSWKSKHPSTLRTILTGPSLSEDTLHINGKVKQLAETETSLASSSIWHKISGLMLEKAWAGIRAQMASISSLVIQI